MANAVSYGVIHVALDKAKICEKSLEIINESGLEALTMRLLAKALGVKAASLYNHIKDKDDLYDLVQEEVYKRKTHIPFHGDWKVHLRALLCENYEGLLHYPKLLPLFSTRPIFHEALLKQAEETMAGLVAAGFTPDESMEVYHNLHAFLMGFVSAEVGQPHYADENYQERNIQGVDLTAYPTLAKVKPLSTLASRHQVFLNGVEAFITGLEKQYHVKEKTNE